MTIYDLVTAQELASFWNLQEQDREPFMGEELFPSDQKLGLSLSWIKGSKGVPVVLKNSAFDVASIPRPRLGFEKLSAEMPFFKESKYIDEEMRQELNKVLESGNQIIIDAIVNRIFDDEVELVESARVTREVMRMMLISSGTITLQSNGQLYHYDYAMPATHKVNATTDWSNPNADIIGDIRKGIETISDDEGVTVTRAICGKKVLGYMRHNKAIRDSINDVTNPDKWISDAKIRTFLQDELELAIATNDKKYKLDIQDTQTYRYIPEDVFILIPSGNLGKTWMGTTPEQSDLMSNPNIANVAIVDKGVAITTMKKADPVQVETKVTQISLPDFPTANQIYIIDIQP